MSKKNKKKSTEAPRWLTFNTEMPEALIPLYDFLQRELTFILTDDVKMKQIKKIDLGLRKGDYWREVRNIVGDDFKQWKLGANAWYARMIYENIRRLMASGAERRAVCEFLEKHDRKPDKEFLEALNDAGFYPTSGTIANVLAEICKGTFTEIPQDSRFVLDFSTVSDKSIDKKINDHRWLFRIDVDSWLDIDIRLPKNIRKHATGKIAKPRFVKRKHDDKYVACISYEIEPDSPVEGEGILGVDLGEVKAFSAASLDIDGIVGTEYLVSHRTQRLIDKFDLLEARIDKLAAKQDRCREIGPYATGTIKFERREKEIELIAAKKRRLKDEIVNFIAMDIVLCALMEDCGEIHVEFLSWLASRGGSWSHSEIQSALCRVAAIHGLRVYRVNAANSSYQYPWSKEIGVESGRDIVFEDGWVIDRDFLSDVNLAARPVKKGGKRREVASSFKERKRCNPRRVRRPAKVRRCYGDNGLVNEATEPVDYANFLNEGTDVVVFSAGVAGLPAARLVTVPGSSKNENLATSNVKDKPI